MPAEFTFSIRSTLRSSWKILMRHAWFFIGLSLVIVILNLASKANNSALLQVLVFVVALVWSYVWISVMLSAVDGKEERLSFNVLKSHLPTVRNCWTLILIGILKVLIIAIGFVLLIIPGIYFMVKLSFTNFVYVDQKGKAVHALKSSWHMIKGDTFWTVFLTMLVAGALIILGLVVFGVGVLVTYPIATLLIAKLYRDLQKFQSGETAVIEQPKEISPAQVSETPNQTT